MSFAVNLLRKNITIGGIELIHADGRREQLGPDTPTVQWQIKRKGTIHRILLNPTFRLGETYMNGDWNVPSGQLAEFINILRMNLAPKLPKRAPLGLLTQSWNSIRASARNAQRHYDLPDELFECMLDREMHYSCAYFNSDDISLEEAQRQKSELIRKKLLLQSGDKVLDIGCGWGSLAIYLAQEAGVRVTGITLSHHQLRVAKAKVRQRGLENLVNIELEDYRQHKGEYDAIVSVGMFEHVGLQNYHTFFECMRMLLKPRGVALLHTIGQSYPPIPTNSWIKRYIFPGGYIPALSEIMVAVQRSRLVASDIEVWRRHYAKTLREWNNRFQSARDRFVDLRGERFCRMWEFYLAVSETGFELDDLVVFQLQLAAENDAVPTTRDYLYSS